MGLWDSICAIAAMVRDLILRFPELVTGRDGRLSHTKVGTNTAYIVGTVVFIHLNIKIWQLDPTRFAVAMPQLAIIWGIYFGVIAGHQWANNRTALKFGQPGGSGDQPQ